LCACVCVCACVRVCASHLEVGDEREEEGDETEGHDPLAHGADQVEGVVLQTRITRVFALTYLYIYNTQC